MATTDLIIITVALSGALVWCFFGSRNDISAMIAVAPMAASSLSGVDNANERRRYQPPGSATPAATAPAVQTYAAPLVGDRAGHPEGHGPLSVARVRGTAQAGNDAGVSR